MRQAVRATVASGLATTALLAAAAACGSAGASRLQPRAESPNGDPPALASADLWNYPNRNFFRCVVLEHDSAQIRFPDGAPVGAPGQYEVRTSATRYDGDPGGAATTDRMSCPPGQIRLDAHEALVTAHGLLQFHKGGQGYSDARVPYGHIAAADIVGGDTIVTQRPASLPPEWGAPSAVRRGGWDDQHRNGRGCEAVAGEAYHVRLVAQGSGDALPDDWQYKPNQSSSRYAKYADAGPDQGTGTAHYAYLVWSWLLRGDGVTKSDGGGMVRALMRDGQPFFRCAVQAIDGIAYAPRSATEVGRVTAVYGKTRTSADGPWIYGWAIYAHRARLGNGSYASPVLHMVRFTG